jgi:heme-binding protein
MRRWIKPALIVFLGLLVAIQFVRLPHTNPPFDPRGTIQAQLGPGVVSAVIDRSCRDCHSNQVTWPWYSHVAPVSWLIAHDVNDGRDAVNFSEWASYAPARQRKLLADACEEVTDGEMPGLAYTLVHRQARPTTEEVFAICALSGKTRVSTH